jgi:hypothetical protein
MKTFKVSGIIAFVVLSLLTVYKQNHAYDDPATEQLTQTPAPETVYVEKPASPPQQQEQEIYYYDPDNPDVLYREEDIHLVDRFGTARNTKERYYQEWYRDKQSQQVFGHHAKKRRGRTHERAANEQNADWEETRVKKQYKPAYEIIPVETNQ